MRLVENFCKILLLDRSDNGFRASVELLPHHRVYEGHFPARAVVPGVFTLAIVRECASAALSRTVEYASIRECKFLSALQPGEGVVITLDFSISEGDRICGTVKRDDETILKLKAVLR